jgi:hypothetical protein
MNIDTAIQFLTDLKLEQSSPQQNTLINLQFIHNEQIQERFYQQFISHHARIVLSNQASTSEEQLFLQCFVIAWFFLIGTRLTSFNTI